MNPLFLGGQGDSDLEDNRFLKIKYMSSFKSNLYYDQSMLSEKL